MDLKNWPLKKNDYVQEYMSKVSGVVNHIGTYDENINNEIVVSKVLRSLTKGSDNVATIEESKDLSTYTFDELMSSLLADKVWISRSSEKVEKNAFLVKREPSFKEKLQVSNFRGYGGKGSFHSLGRSRGQAQLSGEHSIRKCDISKIIIGLNRRINNRRLIFPRNNKRRVIRSWLTPQ